MSRKIICDFCSTEFSGPEAFKLNWCEELSYNADICAECAMQIVRHMVEFGGYTIATLQDYHIGSFPPKKSTNLQQILSGGLPGVMELHKQEKESKAARDPRRDPLPGEEDLDFELDDFPLEPPGDPTSFDPPTVFHLTMHGAGLNPEHELLFQTLDEAKDYAAKNAQVFPEAAYFLSCPDGTDLVGTPDPPASYNQNDPVASIHWKVKSQPKKA